METEDLNVFRKRRLPGPKECSPSPHVPAALRQLLYVLFVLFVSCGVLHAQSGGVYYPGRTGDWDSRRAEDVGMDAGSLQEAADFALANEFSGSSDLRAVIASAFEADNTIVGPTKHRGGPAGLVIKDGFIVAEWGDTKRVDMTFSVTKSYLSTVAGLAFDAGLIHDVHDRVGDVVWDGTFASEHNSKITWHHLLNQSSDWSGTLWDKPDWADRPPRDGTPQDWARRELKEPGTSFEYNDVRVNVLAYSLLQVWRRPLPVILRERIMDPIGASPGWRWHGYENSWVVVDGLKMQSVSGGGHRGGGMFISTRDQARFGYLLLRNGRWKDKQLISEEWIQMLQVPSEARPNYGYMWWLNHGPRSVPGWPDSMFMATGFGGNNVVVDQDHDLLIVIRWLDPSKFVGFVQMVLDSVGVHGEREDTRKADWETAEGGAANDHRGFVGVHEFDFEGERIVFEFTVKKNKLWVQMVPKEYELGELVQDEEQPTLFRKTTIHGEHWAFEFTKGAGGEPVQCKFIDEDLGLELVGVRIDRTAEPVPR